MGAALFYLLWAGHTGVAALVLAAILVAHYLPAKQRLTGAVVCWDKGRWALQNGSEAVEMHLQRAHCLSWLTFAQWRQADGTILRLWLLNGDSERDQLRRLRVRLRLERGV
ncbi:hypothetical protein C0039_14355 [Pseudohalioglobus lutimaris]|uniref:Toxin CptA n=1 Tax=Pseudohalioglobus lutimaris TaxID=1737061 RepID=A0A2N5X0H0_9GAMM|nr:hypothetical protein C0039_14355 [Pseudohalioglobus lutimaris]